jgi:hypothetical protein
MLGDISVMAVAPTARARGVRIYKGVEIYANHLDNTG